MKNFLSTLKRMFNPTANPIIVKELRSRMRGARAFITLTGALLFMALVSFALYKLVILTSTWNYTPLSPQVGQTLFMGLVVLEMMMICLITPAITAGAISSEHEKLTYEMLLTTPLKPTLILWGKLISALSYIFLLIFAAIPMASLVFIYGGVSIREMLKALIVLVCTAIMIGTIGIFMSTWLKRSGRATVVSYLVILAMLGVPTVAYGVVALIRQAEPPRWLLVPSPISALFSAISPSAGLGNPGVSFAGGLSMLLAGNISAFEQMSIPRPLYHYTLPLYGLITLILYLLATRLIRPARRWRVKVKDVFVALIVILLLLSSAALAFASTADQYESTSIFAAPTPFIPGMPVEPMMDQAIAVDFVDGLPVFDDEAITAYTAILQTVVEQDIIPDGSPVSIARLIYPDPAAPEELIPEKSYVLAEEIRSGISDSSDELLPFEILWVDEFADFNFTENSESDEEGVLILFGNLNPLKIDFLQVYVTIYTADQSSWNLDIQLDRSTGDWGVIDTEVFGPQPIDGESQTKQISQTFTPEETAGIYSTVILQAFWADTPLPDADIQGLYIVQNTVLAAEAAEILPPVRVHMEAQLEKLPVTITWIESREEAPLDHTSAMDDGSGLIELGEIISREDGTVEVIINLHYDDAAKVLVTYILQNSPEGGWEIVEIGGMG